MAEDETFVGRWSRLKRAAREKPAQPPVAEPGDEATADALPPPAERSPAAPTGEARPPEPQQAAEALPFDPASLPDLESLTFESDYSAFLQKGVPLELRNQALRRLWRSDPVLANLDGLVEYGEDYSGVGTKKMLVRTAYRVGRGMIDWALEEPDKPASADGDAPPGQESLEASHEAVTEPVPAETKPGDAPPTEGALEASHEAEIEADRPATEVAARKVKPRPAKG